MDNQLTDLKELREKVLGRIHLSVRTKYFIENQKTVQFLADDIIQLITEYGQSCRLDGAKAVERLVIQTFEQLCKDIRTDPYLGNSSKGKKDNFLDGAEIMLTKVQYQRHMIEKAALAPQTKPEQQK